MSTIKTHKIVCKIDDDDDTMQQPWVKMLLNTYENVVVEGGLSKSKVDAINRNLSHHIDDEQTIIFNHSDDFIFLQQGFDEIVMKAFAAYNPLFDGVIHYPDGFAKNRTMTYSLIGSCLYKRLGYMYYPEYASVFCDNDLTDMTKQMGKYTFVNKKIFEHLHPHAGLAQWDAQYKANEHPDVYAKDREIYNQRRAINFGL